MNRIADTKLAEIHFTAAMDVFSKNFITEPMRSSMSIMIV